MKDSDAMNRLEEIFRSPMLQINILAALTGACAALMTWIFISMSKGIQSIFYGDSFIHNSKTLLKNNKKDIHVRLLASLFVANILISKIQHMDNK